MSLRRPLCTFAAALCLSAHAAPVIRDVTPPGDIPFRVTAVAVHPMDADRLVAFSFGDTRVSSDAGRTWVATLPRSTGPLRALEERIFAHPARPGVLFVQ